MNLPRSALIVPVTLLVVILAACGGNGSASTTQPSAAPVAPQETRVLKVWHYEASNAMSVAWDAAMKEFEATHPGVKIAFEQKSWDQVRQTASMILSSDEAPDVMEMPKGNATAGLLSTQNLLTDISDVVAQRGWDKLLVPSLQTTCRYNEKGIMGSGKWYGITNYGEYVMVYYNKDVFKQHGLQVPTSLAEFESVMDTLAKAGVMPLGVSGADYPAQQVFYELALSKADISLVNAFQLYQGEMNFHGPEFTFGAERLVEWVQKGYISKDSTSIKSEDMALAFTNGRNPMMMSGSWWYGRFMADIKSFEWGIFLMPGNSIHPGSGGNLWAVPAKSSNKDLAYDFIDITMRQDIQTILGNAGGIPVNADITKISDPKAKELIENFDTIMKNGNLAFYPDWPAPGYYDVLLSSVQDLIAGTKTPKEFLDAIAAPYQEHRASL